MQTLDQNKQTLYYANYNSKTPIYVTDSNGNIITQEIDGEEVAVVDSYEEGYSEPIEFEANISYNSGETSLAEYGLNTNEYDAVICTDKGEFPFDEQTIIWHNKLPIIVDGAVKPESAEYKIIAIKTSLNEQRYILKKRTD